MSSKKSKIPKFPPDPEIGRRLRAFRKARALTQKQFVDGLRGEWTQTKLSDLENGNLHLSDDELVAFIEKFDMDVKALLAGARSGQELKVAEAPAKYKQGDSFAVELPSGERIVGKIRH